MIEPTRTKWYIYICGRRTFRGKSLFFWWSNRTSLLYPTWEKGVSVQRVRGSHAVTHVFFFCFALNKPLLTTHNPSGVGRRVNDGQYILTETGQTKPEGSSYTHRDAQTQMCTIHRNFETQKAFRIS